jgi:hypothetical protein
MNNNFLQQMNKIYYSIKCSPLFVLFIFIASCTGPGKTKAPKESLDRYSDVSKSIPKDTTAKEILTFNQSFLKSDTDPLCYINGQLCAWVREIFQDRRGDLWFGTNHYGVMRYSASSNYSGEQGDRLQYFSEEEGVGRGRITEIVEDKEGNVWFGTYGGLTKFDPSALPTNQTDSLRTSSSSFTNYAVSDGLAIDTIWSLMLDSNGIFWIGTSDGVLKFDGEKFTSFPIPQAEVKDPTPIISHNRITSIIEDKRGNIWFGTDGYGICIYSPSADAVPSKVERLKKSGKPFTHLTKKEGLCDTNIHDLLEDSQGNIWIGTMFGGVSKYNPSAEPGLSKGEGLRTGGDTFSNFTQDGSVGGVEVGGFYEDKTGTIWFAAENYGVYRYNGSSFTNFYKNEGLNTNGILSIFEDAEGRFWFGGWGGLFRYDGTSFLSVTKDGPWTK